jgi:hypothetical protein
VGNNFPISFKKYICQSQHGYRFNGSHPVSW